MVKWTPKYELWSMDFRAQPPNVSRRRPSRQYGRSRYPDRIVKAAARVIALKSYVEASMDDIAQTARTAKSVLYYYFESKADILFALHEQTMNQSLAQLEEILSSNETPLQRLRRALWVHTKTMCDDRWRRKVSIRTADLWSLESTKKRSVMAKRRKYQSLIQRLFEEAAAAGSIRSDLDLGVVSKIAVAGLMFVSDWYRERGRLSTTQIADIAVEYVLSGLAHDIRLADTVVADSEA